MKEEIKRNKKKHENNNRCEKKIKVSFCILFRSGGVEEEEEYKNKERESDKLSINEFKRRELTSPLPAVFPLKEHS